LGADNSHEGQKAQLLNNKAASPSGTWQSYAPDKELYTSSKKQHNFSINKFTEL
jgi:hypothetical protein